MDTLVICDGGRKDPYGFDAAYITVGGIPIIGYSIRCGMESRYIRKIYVYSDLPDRVGEIARNLYPDKKALTILGPDDPMPKAAGKLLRIIPAEEKLVMSISKTFYRYVVRDVERLGEFAGDWKRADDIGCYGLQHPGVREFPVAFMANDQPLCRAEDLDMLIAFYDGAKFDTLVGYTLWDVLSQFLESHGQSIGEFHYTLKKQDYFDGRWMRHNSLYVSKWGKMDQRAVHVISFYHRHRVQSKIVNFLSVLAVIADAYHDRLPEITKFLFLAGLFAVGKYCKGFGNRRIRNFISRRINNAELVDITGRLIDHRLFLFYQCTARPVIDMDAPKDISAIRKLLDRVGRLD